MERIIFILFLGSACFAGEWTRLSNDTIQFQGEIKIGEIEKLRQTIHKDDQVLVVDSMGGNAEEGLLLGLDLVQRHMKIVVDGFCVSSCANYIFTAGATKLIKKGLVGYHGNLTAVLKLDWEKIAKQLKEVNKFTDEQIEEFHLQSIESSRREMAYLKAIEVSQELFDLAQLPDKGEGDGKIYTLWIPRPETFVKYGINNVEGKQDPQFGSELGLVNLYK